VSIGLELMIAGCKATIHQCQAFAKEALTKTRTLLEFDLVGPTGRIHATWLDPHLGFFKMDGHEGFAMVRQFEMCSDVHCENILPPQEDESEREKTA